MKAGPLRAQGSTRQRPKAEAPTLADGIWQSQLITAARLECAIKIAYRKEVTSNEKCISKPMLAEYGVAPNKVNLQQPVREPNVDARWTAIC
jgi:hypothetical protein